MYFVHHGQIKVVLSPQGGAKVLFRWLLGYLTVAVPKKMLQAVVAGAFHFEKACFHPPPPNHKCCANQFCRPILYQMDGVICAYYEAMKAIWMAVT